VLGWRSKEEGGACGRSRRSAAALEEGWRSGQSVRRFPTFGARIVAPLEEK
jgi:hypothetical protein